MRPQEPLIKSNGVFNKMQAALILPLRTKVLKEPMEVFAQSNSLKSRVPKENVILKIKYLP